MDFLLNRSRKARAAASEPVIQVPIVSTTTTTTTSQSTVVTTSTPTPSVVDYIKSPRNCRVSPHSPAVKCTTSEIGVKSNSTITESCSTLSGRRGNRNGMSLRSLRASSRARVSPLSVINASGCTSSTSTDTGLDNIKRNLNPSLKKRFRNKVGSSIDNLDEIISSDRRHNNLMNASTLENFACSDENGNNYVHQNHNTSSSGIINNNNSIGGRFTAFNSNTTTTTIGARIGGGGSNSGGGGASGFRKFLIVTTIIYISLVNLIPPESSSSLSLLPCWAQGEILSKDESATYSDRNGDLIKSIWEELTQDEIHSIFGSSQSSIPDSVPNFDIVEPKVTHRKTRGKRSMHDSRNKDKNFNYPSSYKYEDNKLIQIEGLGRSFNLTIHQNRNLLDPHFVFLKRRDNQSEIMPEDHVKGQLHCFYQGDAQHVEKIGNQDVVEVGPVAVSLCGGVKGFILSTSSSNGDSDHNQNQNDAHHHYVIHPIPHRLHKFQGLNLKYNQNEHERQHFLFKRQNKLSSPVHQHAKNPKYSVNSHKPSNNNDPDDDHTNNDHDGGTCIHNHSSRKISEISNSDNHQDRLKNVATRTKTRAFTPTTGTSFDVNELRSNAIKASGPSASSDTTNYENVDNKSGNEDTHIRKRRTTDIFSSTDPFVTYGMPLNTAPDSYWLPYNTRSNLFAPSRSISSTAAFPSSYWRQKSAEIHTPTGSGGINTGDVSRSSSHRRSRYRGSRHRHDSDEDEYDRDASASSTQSRSDWSKGVLVYESTSSVEEPDTILPFYTKGRKRSSKIKSTSWSLSGDNPQNAYSHHSQEGSSNYTTRHFRKGRRDDTHFGPDWKSPLDSDIMFSDKSEAIKKQSRYDLVDTNSIYSSPSTPPRDKPPAQLTIETAVFVDKDLYKHMQSNFPDDTHGEVVRIVLAMINAVQLLYHDPSLGHRVDFVLKRLEVLETDPPGLLRPYDIDRFLTNFCKWQKTENPSSDADPLHWDHALILTGLDLYVVHQSGKISNQVVGLAPVAGMCTRSSSCTVNEGRHFESVFVISHEIGHNLGMRHDGPQADNDCDPTSHIMSPTLGSGKITWSPCSRKYLDMFLDTSQSKCLLDKAKSEVRLDHDADGRLPGERFDADRQCVLKYGRGSFHATQQPLEDVCRDLHCRREHYTWTSHPALEGTYCGTEMWCRSGKCVRRTDPFTSLSYDDQTEFVGSNHLPGSETAAYSVQKAVDGVWGKWSLFTDCSSACLYSDDGSLGMGSTGIRLAARRCDSPRPENGGRQCSGPDRRYKTCPAHKICSGNIGRTTISHYANEVCNRAATVDTELTGMGYMMSTTDVERACSVWCETVDNGGPRSRGWSFPDGTSCKVIAQKDSQSFCVAGKCQEFSCNPYSHYALSDEECSFSGSNEVTPQSSWYAGSSGSKTNSRSAKTGWSDWETHSECKLPCLAPAKGLELVKRLCSAGDSLCSGLALSVRLCKPDKSTIIRNGCTRLQTPFEYATKVCSKYAEKITGLSGIGMQLSPTKDDKDRPCRIGCQDASIPYRFYMVNGEDGWFPAGTDCSRGDPDKKAYCVAGKCVDFGSDDTPVYRVNSKLMGKIETLFQRNKRQATYNIMEPLKVSSSLDQSSLRDLVHKFSQQTGNFPSIASRRSDQNAPLDFNRPIVVNSPTSHLDYPPISRGSYGTSGLSSAFSTNNHKSYPHDDSSYHSNANSYPSHNYQHDSHLAPAHGRSLSMEFVDVDSGVFPPTGVNGGRKIPNGQGQGNQQNHFWGGMAVEGSFYEWRKIISDCSVSCGSGIQEVIVECVSGDTVVSDRLCEGRPRPGYSGYTNCYRTPCTLNERADGHGQSSHIWNWLQSILPKNSSSNYETHH